MSPLGGMGLVINPSSGNPALGVLGGDRTIHVDSATGNDATGDGSSARPFADLPRAWVERLTYGELRSKLIVQLHGVGPYTMPVMGASVCGVGGYFQVFGDPLVDVALASGTFTGDLNNNTYILPTSAGLGVNTLKDAFLEITSGLCAGVRTSIVTNTDTGITIPFRAWRTTLGAVANGDTFRVFRPGTVINVPAAAPGAQWPGCYDWVGRAEYPSGYPSGASYRHGFYNVQLTGASISFRNAAVQLIGVRSSLTFVWFERSCLTANGPSDGSTWGVGAAAITNKLSAYGLVDTAAIYIFGDGTLASGVFCVKTSLNIGSKLAGEGDVFEHKGGRFEAGVTLIGAAFSNGGGGNTYSLFQGPASLAKASRVYFSTGGTVKVVFAVTTGSCIDLQDNSLLYVAATTGLTGGTVDVAGYGIRVRAGGGRALFAGALLLTGGTAGADVKTAVAAAVANSFFTAANIFVNDMGGADLVARV